MSCSTDSLNECDKPRRTRSAGAKTTRRPFLTARWRRLAILNFEIDPELLRPHVPEGTELDEYHGRALVSVVGFRFEGARLFGVRVPLYQGFPEVNLRFYVRREIEGEARRGVVFLKEIVPRRMVAFVAGRIYGESFARMPVRYLEQTGEHDDMPGRVEYRWRFRGRWCRLGVSPRGTFARPRVGGEEEFVVDHFWAYSAQRDGRSREYFVEHRPWRICSAGNAFLDADVEPLYGAEFAAALSAATTSAFLADGSEVAIFPGRKIARPSRRCLDPCAGIQ